MDNSTPVIVEEIIVGGPALASGMIAVGDELLSVNGEVVTGRSLEAISCLTW
jgi:C-terminal processing protease CtpA/Prc